MKRRRVWAVVVVLVLAGLVLSIPALLRGEWWGLLLNLGTELVGAAGVYLLLDRFIGKREKEEEEKARVVAETEKEKARLTMEMGSKEHGVAIPAAEKLARFGWLQDGSLRGAMLDGANLQGAELYHADLQGASLSGANLHDAQLVLVDLRGAKLSGADMGMAILLRTNLQDAILMRVDLLNAGLVSPKLQNADLREADLHSATLMEVEYSEDTVLPDGRKWTPETDMARFTDPQHPDFWRSEDPSSPAWGGKWGM